VRDDLAVLLSERFAALAPPRRGTAPSRRAARSRAAAGSVTSLVGRERDIDEVASLVEPPGGAAGDADRAGRDRQDPARGGGGRAAA
jgi:hypothetical protein